LIRSGRSAATAEPTRSHPRYLQDVTFTRRQRFGLVLVLSALALCASVIRFVAQRQTFGAFDLAFQARPIAFMEIGNWGAWTVWAAILVWLVTRDPDAGRGQARRALGIAVLAIAPIFVVPVLASPVHLLAMGSTGLAHSTRHVTGHNLPTNTLLGAAMLGIALGYRSQIRARHLEVTAASLRAQLAESQLAALRSQMDPHFLFNALNGVAVLARRGQTAPIERMVTGLSALLRHSLDSAGTQLVPLRVDFDVLRHYLDIERERFGARLNVTWSVPDTLLERLVPSFLLQPVVENAIRHGFEDATRPLTIAIVGHEVGGALTLVVTDDGAGLDDRGTPADGIGLGNTKARLAGLFGNSASLTMEPGDGGRGVRVSIVIPARGEGA
jgi:two-component system LytT family sensor kinase